MIKIDNNGILKTAVYLREIEELKQVGRIAFDKDLIDTHSGNISMGMGREILITKTGGSLIDLEPQDFTIAPLIKPEKTSDEPSSEIDVHRFILRSFPNSTVLHSHPLNAITLSLHMGCGQTRLNNMNVKKPVIGTLGIDKIKRLYKEYPGLDKITPLDFESAYFFPVIYTFPLNFIEDVKSNMLKVELEASDIFQENGLFMIKSHGSFAWGKTPLDALRWTMMLESSAKILLSF